MIDTNNLIENRCLTPSELAKIIISWREERKWTQETLAELAQISLRTVQRVESGQPSDLDTRRSLARAFERSDIDVFNKPLPFPNEEKIKEETKRLDKTTALVSVESVTSGKKLRDMIESSQAVSFHEYTELDDTATVIFASLQDYMRDYMDICSDLSATEKIDVNNDFQDAIDQLNENGISIGFASRRMNVTNQNWENKEPITFTVVHVVAGDSKFFPEAIRLPKKGQFA